MQINRTCCCSNSSTHSEEDSCVVNIKENNVSQNQINYGKVFYFIESEIARINSLESKMSGTLTDTDNILVMWEKVYHLSQNLLRPVSIDKGMSSIYFFKVVQLCEESRLRSAGKFYSRDSTIRELDQTIIGKVFFENYQMINSLKESEMSITKTMPTTLCLEQQNKRTAHGEGGPVEEKDKMVKKAVKIFIYNFLSGYIQGKITPENEPKDRKPLFDLLCDFLKVEWNISEKEIVERDILYKAMDAYVKIAISGFYSYLYQHKKEKASYYSMEGEKMTLKVEGVQSLLKSIDSALRKDFPVLKECPASLIKETVSDTLLEVNKRRDKDHMINTQYKRKHARSKKSAVQKIIKLENFRK